MKPAELGALHDEENEDVGYRRPTLIREGCGSNGGCGFGGDGDCMVAVVTAVVTLLVQQQRGIF